MKKIFFTALAALLLSSAWLNRSQGQPAAATLSGSWIGTVTLPAVINPSGDTFTFLLTCSSNGTATTVSPVGRTGDEVGVGTWASTGSGQFSLTTMNFHHGSYEGTDKLRATLTLSGDQMSGNAEIVFYDRAGAAQATVGGITLTAKPIVAEPVGSM
jgi:hypothetical protein